MNPITLHITFNDGSKREVTCVLSDFLKFEEKFDKSVVDFQRGMKLTWLVFLAWTSETRTKTISADFEAYTDTISQIDVGEVKK